MRDWFRRLLGKSEGVSRSRTPGGAAARAGGAAPAVAPASGAAARAGGSAGAEAGARANVRRSERVLKKLPITLVVQGHEYPAETAVLNANGCLLLCAVDWYVGAELHLRWPGKAQQRRAKVVWNGGKDPSGLFKLGVELLEPAAGFWGADYES